MKCHEAKRHLDLFMDGELSVPDNLKVLEHLNLCRPCAGVYDGEKALRGALKSQLGTETAPAGLSAKLSNSPAGSPAGSPAAAPLAPVPRRRWLSIAAAAAFFLVAILLVLTNPVDTPKAFAAELSRQHNVTREGFCGKHRDDCLCLCRRCCKDESPNPVGSFFTRHVGNRSCDHDLKDLGYRVVGASVWPHKGQLVCWTVLRDKEGRTITHGLVTTRIDTDSKPVFLSSQGGADDRPMVMEPVGSSGKTCVFIFDTEAEAARFRSARHLK